MKNFILLVLFSFPVLLMAQKASVRGKVFDKKTGDPIGFATVQLEGTTFGANTDLEGFFTINQVPAGDYNMLVSYLGYTNQSIPVKLTDGNIEFINVNIAEDESQLGEVVISGKKQVAQTEVKVSKLTVTPQDIRSLPSAGGQADIAQYLTVLPGVIFTGDQGGQLYIRGGSPVQNKIVLDGMTIYNPFHSIGFFSVFETELIRNVDVYTGGFNAEYGNRVSAIVDINTREGNKKRLGGQLSASPFQIKGTVEGPLVPLKENGGTSVSFLLTAKKALISETSQNLYRYANDSIGIPFDYTDLYGKISMVGGNGSSVNLFGFNFNDQVNYNIADFSWKSSGGGMDFSLIPANSSTIVGGTFAYSKYDSKIIESDSLPKTSGINGLYAQIDFTNFGRNNEIKYGFVVNGFGTNFEFTNFKNLQILQEENTTEMAAFFKWRQTIGPLVIEPSFRYQYYNSLKEGSPEPRLGLKYNVTDNFRLKAAGGMYSQNLLSTINERDVVNLFVGFLSGPEERIFEPGSTTVETSSRLQKSTHGIAGFEYDISNNWDINVEGYYKDFPQLIALNRNKVDARESDFATETGKAYGIDFATKWRGKRAYFWGTYSLGYVRRNDGIQEYPPVFDRRHNMNLLGTYVLGDDKEWELGLRWNLGSGFPFTQTQGFYTQHSFEEGINTDIYGGNFNSQQDIGIIYDEQRNGGRLPYYHRMDVSVKRLFDIGKTAKAEITASATNIYDRPNIFYFDRVNYTRVNQLPILPSIAVTLTY